MTRDVSVFVKCVTIFRLFFLWKLPQFHTSNCRKVVRQHTEGMVGSNIWVLLEIYLAFQQWQNFENTLRIAKVSAMSSVCSFFGPPCIVMKISKALCQQIPTFSLDTFPGHPRDNSLFVLSVRHVALSSITVRLSAVYTYHQALTCRTLIAGDRLAWGVRFNATPPPSPPKNCLPDGSVKRKKVNVVVFI